MVLVISASSSSLTVLEIGLRFPLNSRLSLFIFMISQNMCCAIYFVGMVKRSSKKWARTGMVTIAFPRVGKMSMDQSSYSGKGHFQPLNMRSGDRI